MIRLIINYVCVLTTKNVLFLFLIYTGTTAFSQQKPLPLDPNLRVGKLANGFTYFIRHNESPKSRVVFYLVNKVGSILESEDQQGLAHFLEHMNFNGTTNFPKNQLVDYLQKSGVRFGADLNAYTGFEETVYQLPIPSDDAELLAGGIRIMRDWAHGALLEPSEIDQERGVILEEKRMGKSAQERMRSRYLPLLLNGSRYSHRLPIGTDKVLKSFKPETIRKFYTDWYRPNLQALVIVGDIDVEAIEKVIKVQFSTLKNPPAEKVRTKYQVPLTGKNQFLTVTDKEQSATQIQIMIKHRAVHLSTAGDYRVLILRSLYNQMLMHRFNEVLMKADAPFLQVAAGIYPFMGGLDLASVSVTAKPGELDKGFKAAWGEMTRLKRFGFTTSELERAKKSYVSGLESQLKEQNKTSSEDYAKEYTQYFLNGTAAPGIQKEYELTKAAMADITLAELNKVTAKYFKITDRDILIMAPEKDKAMLPGKLTVDNWMRQVEQGKLEHYVENVNTGGILAAEPLRGKIIKEEKNVMPGLITMTLSNGMKVVLKPTSFKNDEILFSAFANGGTSLYGDKDYQSAANAGSLIPLNGVGNLNMTDLSRCLSGKKLQVQPYISTITQGIAGVSGNDDLAIAMELVHGYFTAPRKDANTFKSIIDRSKVAIAGRANDPNSVFQDTALAFVYRGNPRMTGPSLEKVSQISQDRAFDIYKERFADAANFTFVLVGSIDTIKIRPLLEKYLASLPATRSNERFKDLNIARATGRIEKFVYKGSEPRATVNLVFSGPYEYSKENNMQMAALKEVLQIRILERLREQESGVYTPQVANSSNKYPQSAYQYSIVFVCAPDKVAKLCASAVDEIEKLKNAGPSKLNVDKWKAEYLREMETQLQTNKFWLSLVSSQLQNDEEFQPLESYKNGMEKVTPESLKAAANQYLSGENYIRLVLLPETAKK